MAPPVVRLLSSAKRRHSVLAKAHELPEDSGPCEPTSIIFLPRSSASLSASSRCYSMSSVRRQKMQPGAARARAFSRSSDAPGSANQYKSDYDILVIVSQKELTHRAAYWAKAEERLIRAYTIEKTLRTPVNFIVHSLHEVNDGLAHAPALWIHDMALRKRNKLERHSCKVSLPRRMATAGECSLVSGIMKKVLPAYSCL